MKNTKRRNVYTVNLEEVNGQFRVFNVEKVQPVNQYRWVLKPANARNLARQLNTARVVAN